ncbi:MAG: VanZ family protein [Bacteroidales bacterium]|nr:VanZ family protein [Bacteroidales bacterium]
MLRYVFQYKFSILLVIVIALLSLVPGSSMPYPSLFSIPYIDKIVHLSMYASLGFVALMESRRNRQGSVYHLFIIAVIFLLSGLIEILQATVVATRGAEWTDLLANLAGLFAGYLAYRFMGGFRLFRFLKS